ncbi:MAG TPA: shikimate kinase [Bacilli bacterium]
MMKRKNVVLVGFMGTGKSSVGHLLAKRLAWPFLDIDHLIELQEGISIPDLFGSKGEDYFRRVESQVIHKVMEQDKQVIATGGGAVLAEDNRNKMLKNGYVIALSARKETIIARVKLDHNRPLLQGNVDERVGILLEHRKHAYDFADLKIDTTELTKDTIVEMIINGMEALD